MSFLFPYTPCLAPLETGSVVVTAAVLDVTGETVRHPADPRVVFREARRADAIAYIRFYQLVNRAHALLCPLSLRYAGEYRPALQKRIGSAFI